MPNGTLLAFAIHRRTRYNREHVHGNDLLRIADREFHSRLIVGTGKYATMRQMMEAHEASGARMVTVAVRRVNLDDRTRESVLDYIPREKYFILPNTAGCYTAEEAIRTARLARETGLSHWVKLEVIGDEARCFPTMQNWSEPPGHWSAKALLCCPTPMMI